MPRARARIPLPVVLALLIALAGCTRNDTQIVAAGPGATAELRLTEYRVAPIVTRTPPGEVTFRATNAGALAHDVSLVKDGIVLARTTTIAPGSTAAMRVRLGPGTYRVLSSLSNDETLGLFGFVVVE